MEQTCVVKIIGEDVIEDVSEENIQYIHNICIIYLRDIDYVNHWNIVYSPNTTNSF